MTCIFDASRKVINSLDFKIRIRVGMLILQLEYVSQN